MLLLARKEPVLSHMHFHQKPGLPSSLHWRILKGLGYSRIATSESKSHSPWERKGLVQNPRVHLHYLPDQRVVIDLSHLL